MIATLAALALFGCASDVPQTYPISYAMDVPEYKKKLGGMTYYFAGQQHPAVGKTFKNIKVSARSTPSGVDKQGPCARAFVSALLNMRRAALAVGGNAVVDIKSNWKHNEISSKTRYQCVTGFLMTGVALKGTVVQLYK